MCLCGVFDVLVMCLRLAGNVFAMRCAGDVLVMYLLCAGNVLAMCLWCVGDDLAVCMRGVSDVFVI